MSPVRKKKTSRGRSNPQFPVEEVMAVLAREAPRFKKPSVTAISEQGRDPFRVLISTVLSLRTKDETTYAASERLFALADTPAGMLDLPIERIAETIFPVGFYRVKAQNIHAICRELMDRYDGEVPWTIEELVQLKGVGRKTANLVMTLGHGLPAICVDTHVHRITNRWGYVKTDTPDQTETVLRTRLPLPYWIPINDWLVCWGQYVCRPISPHCSRCELAGYCRRVGVERSR